MEGMTRTKKGRQMDQKKSIKNKNSDLIPSAHCSQDAHDQSIRYKCGWQICVLCPLGRWQHHSGLPSDTLSAEFPNVTNAKAEKKNPTGKKTCRLEYQDYFRHSKII